VSDAVKGGLFVAAAVATGLLAGLFVPSLVGAERETASRPRAPAPALPTMPGIIGRRFDEAQDELRRRGIPYVTVAPDIVAVAEVVAPATLEVCDTEPGPGRSVRDRAHLHAAFAGTCGI
jgi:hypothetical protein